jgi:hypothetical protein
MRRSRRLLWLYWRTHPAKPWWINKTMKNNSPELQGKRRIWSGPIKVVNSYLYIGEQSDFTAVTRNGILQLLICGDCVSIVTRFPASQPAAMRPRQQIEASAQMPFLFVISNGSPVHEWYSQHTCLTSAMVACTLLIGGKDVLTFGIVDYGYDRASRESWDEYWQRLKPVFSVIGT